MKPIGTIETPFRQKFGIPRQGCLTKAQGELKLDKSVVSPGALDGLAPGDPIWLIFLFHESQPIKKGKIKPPRLKGQSLGIFATRSPHRPNPIGLSLCTVIGVDTKELSLHLEGVDLLHGTPILDIKPFIAYADIPRDLPENDWRHQNPSSDRKVIRTDSFIASQKKFSISESIVSLAESCLLLDPRPSQQTKTSADYWMALAGYDFCFQINGSEITLKSAKLLS